jgi:hypothetical protein
VSTDHRYRVPAELAFSFVAEVMLQQHRPADRSVRLFEGCSSLADALFDALGAVGATTTERSEAQSEETAGPFTFPVTTTRVRHSRGAATYRLELERMFNGHLGCNEDNLRLELSAGGQTMRGGCYLFTGDTFRIEFEGVAAGVQTAVREAFVTRLGLLPIS